jgi:hypothetical protein
MLGHQFDDNSAVAEKQKVLVRVDPRWEYIHEFPPGMHDCGRSLCSVELKSNAGARGHRMWKACNFVTFQNPADLQHIDVEEFVDCVFGPIMDPSCVRIKTADEWARSLGIEPGKVVLSFNGIPMSRQKDYEDQLVILDNDPEPSSMVFCTEESVSAPVCLCL